MASANIDDTGGQQPHRQLDIELLALDFAVCPRCGGTQHNLEQALALLQPVLTLIGCQVKAVNRLIQTAEQARQVGLTSSPTIRINGHDIMPVIQESHCEACAGLCGTEEETLCRVWLYQGKAYQAAPVALLVDAILSSLYATKPLEGEPATSKAELPANLAHFFRRRAKVSLPCCPAAAQSSRTSSPTSCCEPDDVPE